MNVQLKKLEDAHAELVNEHAALFKRFEVLNADLAQLMEEVRALEQNLAKLAAAQLNALKVLETEAAPAPEALGVPPKI